VRVAVIAVALLAVGCGGGASESPIPSSDTTSVTGSAGAVTVSGAFVSSSGAAPYAAGGSAVAQFSLLDKGGAWDTLTSVTSGGASQVQLYQDGIKQTQVSVPNDSDDVAVTGQLLDLQQGLAAGDRVAMTFHFTGAGSLTLEVPVH
jgi:copper(I)-binding protein